MYVCMYIYMQYLCTNITDQKHRRLQNPVKHLRCSFEENYGENSVKTMGNSKIFPVLFFNFQAKVSEYLIYLL